MTAAVATTAAAAVAQHVTMAMATAAIRTAVSMAVAKPGVAGALGDNSCVRNWGARVGQPKPTEANRSQPKPTCEWVARCVHTPARET